MEPFRLPGQSRKGRSKIAQRFIAGPGMESGPSPVRDARKPLRVGVGWTWVLPSLPGLVFGLPLSPAMNRWAFLFRPTRYRRSPFHSKQRGTKNWEEVFQTAGTPSGVRPAPIQKPDWWGERLRSARADARLIGFLAPIRGFIPRKDGNFAGRTSWRNHVQQTLRPASPFIPRPAPCSRRTSHRPPASATLASGLRAACR